jgi:hypothetical protein
MKEFWELPPEEMLHSTGAEWFLALLDSCKQEEVGNLATILCGGLGLSEIKLLRTIIMDASVELSVL